MKVRDSINKPSNSELQRRIQELEARLAESEETLRAIREGEVDAIIVRGSQGEQVFSLSGAESVYRLIIETMQEAAFTADFNGKILYCNAQLSRFLKQPPELIVGHSILDFVESNQKKEVCSLLITARKNSVRQRILFQSADGELKPAHISANVLKQPDQFSICLVASDLSELESSTELIQQLRDQQGALQTANEDLVAAEEDLRAQTNELVAARDALKQSEVRFRALVEASSDVLYRMSPDWAEMTQLYSGGFLTNTEAPSRTWLQEYIPPDEQSRVTAAINEAIRNKGVFELEHRVLRIDGATGWTFSRAVPLIDSDGHIIEWFGAASDITGRKQMEEALRFSEEKFAQAFANNPAAISLTHLEDGLFVDVNDTWVALTGYTREEAIGHFARAMKIWPSAGAAQRFVNELKTNRSLKGWEQEFQKKSGEVFVAQLSAQVLELRGEVLVLSTIVDITRRKRAEQEFAAAKAAAESANRAKDHFLAVLSHELRTPLTPVVMGVSMLQGRPDLDPQARETLEMIKENVNMEARLIDDLLDVTRIARGKIELNRSQVELCTVIQRAVDVCKPDIEARRLHFGVDIGPDAPYWIDADSSRLQQVIWNLLKNAIKFTPHGGCVGIRCRQSDGYVSLEVNDSGIGIEPEALSRVFKAFEQAERSITRQFGGLGLGLAISKALVEMHNGEIEVHSEGRNKGATFRLRLPLALREGQIQKPVATSAPARSIRPLHILLVEDHGVTAQMISMVLREEGHTIEAAGDVATALELAGRGTFDLLLSDLGLPDGSGHELLRELHARGHKFPAIALSGYGQEIDIHRSHDAGFVRHLIKPASREALTEAVNHVAANSRP